jgi:hypothetical protein
MAAVISQATTIGAQPAISCTQVIIRAPLYAPLVLTRQAGHFTR